MEEHLHSKQERYIYNSVLKDIEYCLIFNILSYHTKKGIIQYFILILFFLFTSSLDAQTISRSVIGITGGQNVVESKTVNWTLGEAFIGSFKSDHNKGFLSVGFQQGDIQEPPNSITTNLPINVSPNPTSGWLSIYIPDLAEEELTIQLSDMSGRTLFSPQKLQKPINELDLSIYPAGVYLLTVKGKNAINQSLKVVKTDY